MRSNVDRAAEIRSEMAARDLTMSQVARRLGVSPQYIRLILHPPYSVSEGQARAILREIRRVPRIKPG